MKIVKTLLEEFVKELTSTKVDVQFSDMSINAFPCFNPETGQIDMVETKHGAIKTIDEVVSSVSDNYYVPFRIIINDKFLDEGDNLFHWRKQYNSYIFNRTQDVISEIDANINLRLGKWDILDYFSVVKLKLNDIRSGFYEIGNNCVETNCKKLLRNRFASIIANNDKLRNTPGISEWVDLVLTYYWNSQVRSIDKILDYIKPREEIINLTEDYVKPISALPQKNRSILWEASDTDLLELIVALVESGSLQNHTKSLTRKEAIEFFSEIFGLEIKDAESKLSRATERKKDLSPFLSKLKQQFEKYVHKKDERTENLRK